MEHITQIEALQYHGALVACVIQGLHLPEARLLVMRGEGPPAVYLCQDIMDGAQAPNMFDIPWGYQYTWKWDNQVSDVWLLDKGKGASTTMSDKLSISEALKLIDLDDDKYLLRKYDIIDDSEDVTEEGKKILWRIILASNIEEVVKKLNKYEARNKADKKSKKETD